MSTAEVVAEFATLIRRNSIIHRGGLALQKPLWLSQFSPIHPGGFPGRPWMWKRADSGDRTCRNGREFVVTSHKRGALREIRKCAFANLDTSVSYYASQISKINLIFNFLNNILRLR